MSGGGEALAAAVEASVGDIAARAPALDAAGRFPHEDIAHLSALGAWLAPFPATLGGSGLGTEARGAAALMRVLHAMGRGNLSLGRLYEAHVNAVQLLCRHGSGTLRRRAAEDAAGGLMFGLWVTDPPGDTPGLHAGDGWLDGAKQFCSGAGHIQRAVLLAATEDGPRLVFAACDAARVTPLAAPLAGMRAAGTGQVAFARAPIATDAIFGVPGAYLREPDFSGGAWRTSAVTSGGLAALVEEAMRQLAARGRASSPHQQDRLGRAWIAAETARLWSDRAARAAEGLCPGMSPSAIVAEVNFARIAIETAALDGLTLVERSLGLAAFAIGNPVERIARDLRTYLRQPAPDAVLTEAAAFRMAELA